MPKLVDLRGRRFGRLTVLSQAQSNTGNARWACRCDCGSDVVSFGQDLRRGKTLSCGCLHREIVRNQKTALRHGLARSRIYSIWNGMRMRCMQDAEHKGHPGYSGRGILVCDRWNSFENFLADMGEPPSSRHTIDRIDNEKGYEPANCRWATYQEQARNRRTSRLLCLNGHTRTIAEWADITGINRSTIESRIDKQGWSVEQALTVPIISKTTSRQQRMKLKNPAGAGS